MFRLKLFLLAFEYISAVSNFEYEVLMILAVQLFYHVIGWQLLYLLLHHPIDLEYYLNQDSEISAIEVIHPFNDFIKTDLRGLRRLRRFKNHFPE